MEGGHQSYFGFLQKPTLTQEFKGKAFLQKVIPGDTGGSGGGSQGQEAANTEMLPQVSDHGGKWSSVPSRVSVIPPEEGSWATYL